MPRVIYKDLDQAEESMEEIDEFFGFPKFGRNMATGLPTDPTGVNNKKGWVQGYTEIVTYDDELDEEGFGELRPSYLGPNEVEIYINLRDDLFNVERDNAGTKLIPRTGVKGITNAGDLAYKFVKPKNKPVEESMKDKDASMDLPTGNFDKEAFRDIRYPTRIARLGRG